MDSLFSSVLDVAGTAIGWLATIVIIPLASMVLYLIGKLLILTASLFNALVQFTVVDFAGTIQSFGILDGVQVVWSAFRDVANIAIIGMFVFVAISMILGNQNFGTKRFVARVLLIAVLINFSLLFTKLAIDASHIFARQFYNGIVSVASASYSTQGTGAESIFKEYGGIAGAFLDRAGLTSGFDTMGTLLSIRTQGGSVWALVAYVLTISTFMVAFIVSFAYGSWLLASRAVLMVFLLLTSSLAFASNLIPAFRDMQYGWRGWWDALIKNALLAPLMMIFLWASLTVLQPRGRGGAGTLGAFYENPGDTSTWSALILFLFAAGMLFVSLKLSSSFSTNIPGFGMLGSALRFGARYVAPIAGGAVGMGGKLAVGMPARLLHKKYGEYVGPLNQGRIWSGADDKVGAVEKALARMSQRVLKTASAASYNPARVPTAMSEKYKDFVKRFGFDTGGKGGVLAAEKRALDATAKRAREQAEFERVTAQKAQDKSALKAPDKAGQEQIFKDYVAGISNTRKMDVDVRAREADARKQEAQQRRTEWIDANKERGDLQKQIQTVIAQHAAAADWRDKDRLKKDRASLERSLTETTEKAKKAMEATRAALEGMKKAEGERTRAEKHAADIKSIEAEAYQESSDWAKRKTQERLVENVEKLYPGDAETGRAFSAQAVLASVTRQKEQRKQQDLLSGAIKNAGLSLSESGTPPGGAPKAPSPGPSSPTKP